MSSGSTKRHRVSGDTSSPLRTAIACRACRDRKTRCSGHQPTCTYCFKAGVPCEYGSSVVSSSSSNLDEWGARILDAIDNISVPSVVAANGTPLVTSPPVRGLTPSLECVLTRRSPIAGLPSILEWQVFNMQSDGGPITRYKQALSHHANQQHSLSQATGRESATCAAETLLALVDIFQATFLPSIPILNTEDLRGYVLHIGEYGDMWNVEACLVFMVAALASMLRPTSTSLQHGSSTVSMALRYWNMAKKRLAWALEESGIVAAQCQLLAGIWYIYASEPAAAFQMLNGSLLAIDIESSRPGLSTGGEERRQPKHSELRDNIRYMCTSLLSRLRCEVTYSLPCTSYNLRDGSESPEIKSTLTRSLYSLLLIRQSILGASTTIGTEMSVQELGTLHQKIIAAVQSLDDWYTRLPDSSKSLLADPLTGSPEIPTERPEVESQCNLLQWQYLEARELVLRPSLYLALHTLPSLRISITPGTPSYQAGLSDVVQQYYMTQFHSMMIQHRNLILNRLRFFLNYEHSNPSPSQVISLEMGWFKIQTSLSLGLMLIASMQYMGDTEPSTSRPVQWGPNEEDCIMALENWLRTTSEVSGVGSVHADLLRDLRTTHCNNSFVFL
ncbi:unnamed protein product [Clonostachys rosea]|uniref:Zn(2)-C6 fungal-type domain-containing protein n=1 Tax=Bionectria ochroleuca TaxID=29856 RepID=A0ABY6UFT4_BIOOC|nr:unnamed protein product [Clonostachys rosea]